MKIAIVGCGVVGTAVATSARLAKMDVATLDKYDKKKTQNIVIFDQTDVCFVCVPTPSNENGQDLTELESALGDLSAYRYRGVVVVKSTILPGTMDKMAKLNPLLRLVHNPEFLTERTAAYDFANQKSVLLSGHIKDTVVVDKFYDIIFLNRDFKTYTSRIYASTEFAKYIHNCFLATKVSFFNEIFQLTDNNKELFESAVRFAQSQGNIGESHCKVPGPDRNYGFGGMCFIKDTEALAKFAEEKKIQTLTLNGAIATNRSLRPTAYDGTEKNGFVMSKKGK